MTAGPNHGAWDESPVGEINPDSWMVYFMENMIEMDDLGVSLF